MSEYQSVTTRYQIPPRAKYVSDYQRKYGSSSPQYDFKQQQQLPQQQQLNVEEAKPAITTSPLESLYADHLKKQVGLPSYGNLGKSNTDVAEQKLTTLTTLTADYVPMSKAIGALESAEDMINALPQKINSSPKKTPTKGKMNYRDSAVFSAEDTSEEERETNNTKTTNGKSEETKKEKPSHERRKKKEMPLGTPLRPLGMPLSPKLDEKSAQKNLFQIMEKVGIELKNMEVAEKVVAERQQQQQQQQLNVSFDECEDWEIAMNVNNPILQKACENIYDHVKQKDGTVSKQGFMDDLELRGILRDDPRISEFISAFKSSESSMSKEVFTACISRNISVIENAFTNSNIIYDFESFTNTMKEIFLISKSNEEGAMADYIPQLAKQNPDHWGLSVCSIDGQRFNLGDSDAEWCIQSCSKPISYCLALEEHGVDQVHNHVGREPSGIQFNALKLNKIGRPHNPLINSGAIMVCSLIKNLLEPADRFDYVLNKWEQAAGGKPLGYANSVYLSERMTGDRNFALAYFMRENKAFPEGTNIVDVLEFYFQCCSMTITTNYMSIVAATLANGGVCPITGEQVFSAATVKSCLSMMYSCGMYDYSGEFAFNIGLPAKSGVAGGVFVVVPNVMGMCTFSPRLDKYGNSARGVDFYTRIITKFNFHLFDNIEMTTSTKENPRKSKDQDEVTIEKIIKFSSVGDLSALRRLRIKNSDLSVGDYDRRTPMHLAASNGHLNVVKYLHESGGVKDVNPIDRWLGTPYDDSIREGHHDVAEFLKSVGGHKGSGSPV